MSSSSEIVVNLDLPNINEDCSILKEHLRVLRESVKLAKENLVIYHEKLNTVKRQISQSESYLENLLIRQKEIDSYSLEKMEEKISRSKEEYHQVTTELQKVEFELSERYKELRCFKKRENSCL